MRQPADDRALYYRQLRDTIATVFAPELTSATAKDAAGLVDRILAEFIVEEEWAPALSAEFGAEFHALLGGDVSSAGDAITPDQFVELRRRAAVFVADNAGSDDEAEQLRCRRLVDVERRFLERVDELRRVVLDEAPTRDASASPTECSVTGEELGAYLRGRCADSAGLRVTRLEALPGGRSKETLLVSLAGTTALPAEVIVRKDRPVGLLETRASDEFAILRAVHAHGGVPVAEPFFADEAKNLSGVADDAGTLLVMERVRGEKAGEYFPDLAAPPPAYRRAIGAQLASALANLHAVPLDTLADTGLDVHASVSAASLSAAVDGMATRIGDLTGPPVAAVPLARRWLLDHIDDVVPSGPLCLLQGDFGLHNTLVEGDRVTALVDWEAATIGPPARELAAAWPAATALLDWPDFVAAYCAAGGSPEATDRQAVTFYRVFFALGACMSSRTGGHLFRTGTKRDLLTAHSGLDAHFRAQRNLARALADAKALATGN